MNFKVIFLCVYALGLAAQVVPVLTRSNGNLRQGAYLSESKITPANVAGLHQILSIKIPGDKRGIESQPLVLPNVTLSGGRGTHDLLVLSTMANDVLGCDLHTGQILWQVNLGRPIKGSSAIDFWGINDYWGVLSTGVIDPDTKTFYAVAWSSPDGTPQKGWHSLHAVDLTTGLETHSPLSMNPLTYNPGIPGLGIDRFAGQMRKQRSALLLITVAGHKTIIVCSGSVLETSHGASGWVAAADLQSWRFTASWATTARYYGGGIWMGGQGPAADAAGNIYFITGNGGFDGVTDFSESFVKLQYLPPSNVFTGMGSFQITDWWSPWSDAERVGLDPTLPSPTAVNLNKLAGTNASTDKPVNHGHGKMAMNSQYAAYSDQDLGSGGVVLIPDLHLVGGAGKDGIWYSVNMNKMGRTLPSDFAQSMNNYAKLLAPPVWFTYACFKHNAQSQIIGYEPTTPVNMDYLDFNYNNLTHHQHSTPIVFGHYMYCFGENGNLRAWKVNNDGSLTFLANGAEQASAQAPRNGGGMPGAMMALSANGKQNAILWALVPLGDANKQITQGYIVAYDATNFGRYSDGAGQVKTLWTSPLYTYNKFNVPVIDNGILIIPTYDGQVLEFGL